MCPFIVLLVFIATSFNGQYCLAQEADSLVVYDTVTIEKDPIIITRTLVLPKEKKTSTPKFLLGLTGEISYYYRYHDVCEECIDFYKATLKTNKAALSYSAGVSVVYLQKKVFLSGGIQYSPYREKFSFTDSAETTYDKTNILTYMDGTLGGGIRIGKESSTQLLVGAEAKVSFLNKVSGSIPDSSSQQSVVKLDDVFSYRKYIPGIRVSARLLTKIFRQTYLMPEVSYSYDLRSMVENEGPYTIQRHIPSFRLTLLRGF